MLIGIGKSMVIDGSLSNITYPAFMLSAYDGLPICISINHNMKLIMEFNYD